MNECYSIIHVLSEISRLSVCAENIDGMISEVMRFMSADLGMARGNITIYNKNSRTIAISEAFGLTDEERERGVYRIGEGITGRVFETGQPYLVERISDDPDFLNKTRSREALDSSEYSFICVPIKAKYGEIIGTLGADLLYRSERNLNEYLSIISIIAGMISQAVSVMQSRIEEDNLKEENRRLHDELKLKYHPSRIIGTSKKMQSVYHLIEKVASSSATVIILGESGVGKELVAQAIHYSGSRADHPFVAFNCAALSESLIESELFGHERGSFTGASVRKKGRFESADGGTLFLDEVSEISPSVQAKLLRVLQERSFERVGGIDRVTVDVRIIAATNRDLEQRIASGEFRADLFYRLNVFPINIPSLRDRRSDIPLLVDFFLEKYSMLNNKSIVRISPAAIDMMMGYSWPGNVRELENVIERAVILSDDGNVHSYHLPPTIQSVKPQFAVKNDNLESRIDAFEYKIIIEEMKKQSGNISRAAQELGITERIMSLRLKKFSINYKDFRK